MMRAAAPACFKDAIQGIVDPLLALRVYFSEECYVTVKS
jgi:hypothetical protein